MPESRIIGANQESIKGSGTIVHEGGDPILIAELEDGMPGTEKSLVFAGTEKVIDGDDIFEAFPEKDRSHKFDGTVLVRALGQAKVSVEVEEEKVAASTS